MREGNASLEIACSTSLWNRPYRFSIDAYTPAHLCHQYNDLRAASIHCNLGDPLMYGDP